MSINSKLFEKTTFQDANAAAPTGSIITDQAESAVNGLPLPPKGGEDRAADDPTKEIGSADPPSTKVDDTPAEQPYSIYTKKEKWLIVFVASLAALFR
jgi:hypothetical protein